MAPNRSLLDGLRQTQLAVLLNNTKPSRLSIYYNLVIPLNVITFYLNRMPLISSLGYDEQIKKASWRQS